MRLLLILALIVLLVPRESIDRAQLIERVSATLEWTASTCTRDPDLCDQAMSTLDTVLTKGGEALAMMEGVVRRNLAASNLGRMPADGETLDNYAIASPLDRGTLTAADLVPPWRAQPVTN